MIIWLASYPKSGNTWVRSFLSNYLSSEENFEFNQLNTILKFPNKKIMKELEIDSSKFINIASNWSTMQNYINLKSDISYVKTHNALTTVNGYEFTNSKNTIGYIYLVRDPRDVVLSYASHIGKSVEETFLYLTNERYMELLDDDIPHASALLGSWANNYNSWKNCDFSKGIIVRYEDLISDPEKNFLEIVKFLNKINSIEIDPIRIKKCCENTNFNKLKELENNQGFSEKGKNNFFRKGKAGDWKNNLNSKVRADIEEIFNIEMKELKYL